MPSNPSIQIIDNGLKFIENNTRVMDLLLNNVGVKIIRASALRAPVGPVGEDRFSGTLLSTHKLERIGLMDYEVSYNKSGEAPYARRWEYETPPNGFTKPGATSHYLSGPAEDLSKPSAMIPMFKYAASQVQV